MHLFFTSVEGSYWHRVTLGEHCFVTKGLLTEEQMWRGKDAFHSYSGQQENYRHHETSHPDTKIVLLMTSHSLDMAAKGQGLQHCHTLNTHTHTLRELCNWAGMRKSGEPLLWLQQHRALRGSQEPSQRFSASQSREGYTILSQCMCVRGVLICAHVSLLYVSVL